MAQEAEQKSEQNLPVYLQKAVIKNVSKLLVMLGYKNAARMVNVATLTQDLFKKIQTMQKARELSNAPESSSSLAAKDKILNGINGDQGLIMFDLLVNSHLLIEAVKSVTNIESVFQQQVAMDVNDFIRLRIDPMVEDYSSRELPIPLDEIVEAQRLLKSLKEKVEKLKNENLKKGALNGVNAVLHGIGGAVAAFTILTLRHGPQASVIGCLCSAFVTFLKSAENGANFYGNCVQATNYSEVLETIDVCINFCDNDSHAPRNNASDDQDDDEDDDGDEDDDVKTAHVLKSTVILESNEFDTCSEKDVVDIGSLADVSKVLSNLYGVDAIEKARNIWCQRGRQPSPKKKQRTSRSPSLFEFNYNF